ncbi:MAG TPA: response regulator transcription factor [Chitinophagaceae bacterium]|nr:response regulator transcription factor [Chitinophagaceae bacterium]
MIKVLIADDHEIVRRGIKQILTEGLSLVYVEEAADCPALVSKAASDSWDIIVSDLAMPGGGGLEALRQIREIKPTTPVLILSIYSEDQYATRVIRAGASGFLNKDAAPEELVIAVQRILSGKRYITAGVAEKLAMELGTQTNELLHELLSEREKEVFKLLATGRSISEVSKELAINSTTVSTYRARILAKTGMKTNADITRYAIENDLI